jgi:prepilin peptidase CpaA
MNDQQLIYTLSHLITNLALLIPLAVFVAGFDIRHRRIPNVWVLFTLVSGILKNVAIDGWSGLKSSLGGAFLALGLMLILHIFGAMGAGDVKLFASIGAVIGARLVLPTFFVVVITGAALAFIFMIRSGTVRVTMQRVMLILAGLLPGWKMPRFTAPEDKQMTLPYGVAIIFGSLISLAISASDLIRGGV